MKKLILIFFLGMFLISFTSATVQVFWNGTRPTMNLELAECGAETPLPLNTTVYLQFFVGGQVFYGEVVGPASHEYSFTTNSTHRCINLSNIQGLCNSYPMTQTTYLGIHGRWSYNRSFLDWGGDGYMPWDFDNNETSQGLGGSGSSSNGGWMSSYTRPGIYWDTELRCDRGYNWMLINGDTLRKYGDTSCTVSYVCSSSIQHHPEIAIPLSQRTAYEKYFNVTMGGFQVYYTNTPPTWEELMDAILENVSTQLFKPSQTGLVGLMSWAQGSMSSNLQISGKTVTFILGSSFVSNMDVTDGSVLSYETLSYSRGRYQHYGNYNGSEILSPVLTNDVDNLGTTNGLNLCATNVVHYNTYDGFDFRCAPNHQSRYFNQDDYGLNSNFYEMMDDLYPNGAAFMNDTTHFENITFYNSDDVTFDYRMTLSIIDDCYTGGWIEHDMKNVISEYRSDKRPILAYIDPPGDLCGLSANMTFHGDVVFKVLMEDGTAIPNANVILISDNNYYSDFTNANGIAIIDLDFYRYSYGDDMGTYLETITTELGDYSLLITADGFQDYALNTRIDTPQEWTISLSTPTGGPTITNQIYVYDGEEVEHPSDYPYLNYEISLAKSSADGLTKPYIIKTK